MKARFIEHHNGEIAFRHVPEYSSVRCTTAAFFLRLIEMGFNCYLKTEDAPHPGMLQEALDYAKNKQF